MSVLWSIRQKQASVRFGCVKVNLQYSRWIFDQCKPVFVNSGVSSQSVKQKYFHPLILEMRNLLCSWNACIIRSPPDIHRPDSVNKGKGAVHPSAYAVELSQGLPRLSPTRRRTLGRTYAPHMNRQIQIYAPK